MLTKAIQIATICFSMANPSIFKMEEPKRANQTYTMTINLSETYNQNIQEPNTSWYYVKTTKKEGTEVSDAFMIKENSYSQTYLDQDQDISIYKNENRENSSVLTILQIAPYAQTVNNELTINYYVRIEPRTQNGNLYTFDMITKLYNSTETYWAKYIDATPTNPYFNYDSIKDVTNPQNGFLYNEDTYTTTASTEENNIQYKNIQMTLSIDPSKTNYVYIWTYLEASFLTGDATSIAQKTGGNHILMQVLNNGTVITGEIIPQIGNYEVIDIPGIMWEVLTMPFTFISVAFNLTLFPNTPYQVNLSNLFLSILGIIIFAFILSKFIKKV